MRLPIAEFLCIFVQIISLDVIECTLNPLHTR